MVVTPLAGLGSLHDDSIQVEVVVVLVVVVLVLVVVVDTVICDKSVSVHKDKEGG